MRTALLAALSILAVTAEGQSGRSVTVRVRTPGGQPVPYAVVSVDGSIDRIADSNGALAVVLGARDSVRVSARRIGFRPFDGWARRAAGDDAFEAAMTPLAAVIDTVRVTVRQSTPLSRTGFYDRAERAQKGATLGEFITPEELDARNPSRLSNILQGRQYSRIAMTNAGGQRQQAVVLGRARCAMNIVLDGQAVTNTLQEIITTDIPTSINPRGSRPTDEKAGLRIGLDDIVDARSVMAIEIYPSVANAPADVIPTASRGACGVVVIWTGARR
ncbi:MAG: hypothetical protein ACYC3F_11930 [Gemmatimonadaceae bacterium]